MSGWSTRVQCAAVVTVVGMVMSGAGVGDATGASSGRSTQPTDATVATALAGRIRCPLNRHYPELGCGRMVDGRLSMPRQAPPRAHVGIKDVDADGRRSSIRLIDVAGTRHQEAVVLLSAGAGGVPWPNYVAVYDGHGELLSTWSVGDAVAKGRAGGAWGAGETARFVRSTATSVDIRISGIATGRQAACCGTGVDVFRLEKGEGGRPTFRLVSRHDR